MCYFFVIKITFGRSVNHVHEVFLPAGLQDFFFFLSGLSMKELSELPSVNKCFTLSYRDLHVAKLANGAEAASLLPEVADGLVAQRRLTVSKWAAVSLRQKGNSVKLFPWAPSRCGTVSAV